MRAGICTVALLILAALASAQPAVVAPLPSPSPSPPPVLAPLPASASPPTPAETILSTSAIAVGQQHDLGIQLQFGHPTGARVQYAVFHAADFSVLAEVFGGAKSAFWGEETVLGVGGRVLFTLASDGENDALLVAPGLGVSYWQAREEDLLEWSPFGWTPTRRKQKDSYYFNLDANVGWLHDLSPTVGWELGINFGVRIGISGPDDNGKSLSGKVHGGTIGVYTGLRF